MQNNLEIIEIYTILVGTVLIAIYFSLYFIWLYKRRKSIK